MLLLRYVGVIFARLSDVEWIVELELELELEMPRGSAWCCAGTVKPEERGRRVTFDTEEVKGGRR